MIVLRKLCSGSSPATYPTYFPFIGAFLRARPQSASIERLAVPPPCSRCTRHVAFTAPLPDIESLYPLRIRGCARRRPAGRRDTALSSRNCPGCADRRWSPSSPLPAVLLLDYDAGDQPKPLVA